MARLSAREQDRMARARVNPVEQIAAREQAEDVDSDQLTRRAHAARSVTVRKLRTRLRDGLTDLFPGVARARVRARVRRELNALSPRMLRDVGITQSEIPRVAAEQAENAVPQKGGVTQRTAPSFQTAPHRA